MYLTLAGGYTSFTLVFKKLHWPPVEHCSVFKTTTLVYRFLHTDFPNYFTLYRSSYISSYNISQSQNVGNFLALPKFHPST